MKYFHVYTKGLENSQIFREREDYVAGMNFLATCTFTNTAVRTLAFALMSNHFHFVLQCNKQEAERFINIYKNLISRWIRAKYGEKKFLRHLQTRVDVVETENNGLKRLIAYVLNNPVKAGINCVASGYEWSSIRCYFNMIDNNKDYINLGSLSIHKQRKLLHSYTKLPETRNINSSGYIVPESYISYHEVERIYGSGKSMEFFLSSGLSIRKGIIENITFMDTTIKSAMDELLDKKYSVSSISELDDFLKKNIIKDLRSRFSASSKQLSRITGITISDIIRYIE